jgi:HlyD family secretion protein
LCLTGLDVVTNQPEALPASHAHTARWPSARALTIWVCLAIGVVIGAISFAGRMVDAPEMPVARVARKDVSDWIATNGKVEPTEPHVIVARLDSFVREVSVAEGTLAAPDQLLLTLDSTELRAQLAHAREEQLAAQEQMRIAIAGGNAEELARLEGDMHRTDAELVKLGRDRESLQRLVEKQAATPDELAQAALALERAQAERQFLVRKRGDLQQRAGFDARRTGLLAERARQTILSLEEQLRSTQVAAPVAGTVYSLPVRVGQHVRIGDSLAEVADLRHLRVRAFIDEPELGSVGVGQAVLITWDALAGRSWAGRIVQVPKTVVPRGGRSVGEVLCSVDNDDMTLLPNINVDVRVRKQVRPHALTVPRAAVKVAGEDRYVFLVKDHRLQRQLVTVGIASTSEYEVLKGLSEGDLVALAGETEPRDGMTVRSIAR